MIEIEKPQIECIETPGDATYGKYVVEPLERGYGTTLGNALRRIMLSSLPGTAPTTIKIAGVQHEFSTIPGVKEDVTEIVLNVKGLLTKLHCETVKTVYIEAVGPCEVKAGDIKADGEVEVLNPDMHIATLDNGATLNMEITLSHGRGYVPADRNKPQQNVIGVIAVDSIYTPVYKVNYTVEPTRVGASSDFDKLTLEVWTDGTISARDAVSLGAKILCDHFTLFTDLSENVGSIFLPTISQIFASISSSNFLFIRFPLFIVGYKYKRFSDRFKSQLFSAFITKIKGFAFGPFPARFAKANAQFVFFFF